MEEFRNEEYKIIVYFLSICKDFLAGMPESGNVGIKNTPGGHTSASQPPVSHSRPGKGDFF
jgi:hypothetical protein